MLENYVKFSDITEEIKTKYESALPTDLITIWKEQGLLHIVTDSIRNSEPYSVSLAFPLHARKRMREECETSRMLILFAGNAVHHDI